MPRRGPDSRDFLLKLTIQQHQRLTELSQLSKISIAEYIRQGVDIVLNLNGLDKEGYANQIVRDLKNRPHDPSAPDGKRELMRVGRPTENPSVELEEE